MQWQSLESRLVDLIHTAMSRSGTNQSGLARVLEVSPSAISDWLRGKRRPEIRYIEPLARLALGP
ncbi:MAG: helix-turn-helix domain-containing protein [Desulfurellales bacterium]|nr:MAG: helix-turn-helix domain-containing protein [Desulfurellales bacterium]